MMYIVDQLKPCTQMYLQKNCKLHKFTTIPIVSLKKSIISIMHHRITYNYVYQFLAKSGRSVKTVQTNILANNRKLHKFALPIVILKKIIISEMHLRTTYMYQFSANSD